MRVSLSVVAAILCLCLALPAAAQGIGILQSAETIDPGIVKLMAAPLLVFGKDGAEDEFGVGARVAYGFARHFDAAAKLGLFENSTYLGADGEYWLMRGREEDTGVDVALMGGLHYIFGRNDRPDVFGIDLTPYVSGHVSPKLELCGGLAASFEWLQDAPAGLDDSFTRIHLVPGVEYRLADDIDLVAEFGIGLNDNSSNYLGAGVAFYFR